MVDQTEKIINANFLSRYWQSIFNGYMNHIAEQQKTFGAIQGH